MWPRRRCFPLCPVPTASPWPVADWRGDGTTGSTRGGVTARRRVLVPGASGGVGSLAVALLAAFGQVWAIVRSPGKCGCVETLAAAKPLIAGPRIRRGASFDRVIDTRGAATFSASVRSLGPGRHSRHGHGHLPRRASHDFLASASGAHDLPVEQAWRAQPTTTWKSAAKLAGPCWWARGRRGTWWLQRSPAVIADHPRVKRSASTSTCSSSSSCATTPVGGWVSSGAQRRYWPTWCPPEPYARGR